MGVLDIRLRSASLGNYGNIPSVRHVDFSQSAAIRNATAARETEAANAGLQRLGNFVVQGVNMYAQMKAREDDRKVTEAANKVQERYNTYMEGDGSAGSGAMNANFDDGKKWMEDNGASFTKIIQEVSSNNKEVGGLNLSARQQEMLKTRLSGYKRGWESRQARFADARYDAKELGQAVKGSELADLDLANEDNPITWDNWLKSKQEVIKVNRNQGKMLSDNEAAAYLREEGLKAATLIKNRRLKQYAVNVATSESSKEVGEYYDELIEELKNNPNAFIPMSPELEQALGKDGLGAPERNGEDGENESTGIFKDFENDLIKAKKTAMHDADAFRTRKVQEIDKASHAATVTLELGKDGMSAAQIADAYRSHLDDQSGFKDKDGKPLTWRDAYKEYSQVRGRAVQHAIDIYDREAKRVAKGAMTELSPFAKEGEEDAAYYVSMKKRIIDAERDKSDPTQLMSELDSNQHKVTAAHYLSMYNDLTKKRSEQDLKVRNMVFTEFLGIGVDTFTKAMDKDARGSASSDKAIKELLGSNAEYLDDSWIFDRPNFVIEDVDAAVEYIDQYLVEHPNDYNGAKKALMEIVEPASKAARAKVFRERIVQQRKAKTYSSLEAFKGMK